MKYKQENVKLVVTHEGFEQDMTGFDESTCIQNTPPKKPKSKSSRCKYTIDWVEVEYGDEYKKPKKGESGKQSISSTLVKQLTKCEIESLRQNKHDAYALMMKMN